MKKTFLVICLLLSLMLCGCSKEEAPSGTVKAGITDEAAQTTQEVVKENAETFVEKPFAEEKGLKFVAPGAYTVPVTIYFTTEDIHAISATSSDCTWSAPEISCEADGEDYLTYTVRFAGGAQQKLEYVPKYEGQGATCHSSLEGLAVYDYYTGVEIDPDVEDPFNTDSKNNTRVYTVEYNGKTADITCLKSETQEISVSSYWMDGRVVAEASPVWTIEFTIRAPRGYDGLMLGLAPQKVMPIPDDPLAEEEIDDEIHYFGDEGEKVEDYEFIRVADYVDIPSFGASAAEELN